MERIPTLVVLLVTLSSTVGLAVAATQADVFGGFDEDHHDDEPSTATTTGDAPGMVDRNGSVTQDGGKPGDDTARQTPNETAPAGDDGESEDGETATEPAETEPTEDADGDESAGDEAATATQTAAPTTTATATPDQETNDETDTPANGDGTTGEPSDGDGTDGPSGDGETGDSGAEGDEDGTAEDATGDDTNGDDATGDDTNGDTDTGETDDADTDEETAEPTVVEGEPDISVFAPNRTVAPGDRREFVVQVVNSGKLETTGPDADPADEDAVRTARNVQVTLDDGDAPVEVRGGTVGLGDLQSGATAEAGFEIVVPADADADTYDLEVEVEYEFVDESGGDAADLESETVTEDVELVVTDEARFEVDAVDADVQIGETDTVEVDIENVGDADVTDATVRLRSRNRDLQVDSANVTTRYVGDWDAGEEKTVEFQATAANGSAPQDYAVRAIVRYTDEDGNDRRSRSLAFGVTPDDEQEFELDDVEGPLTVGEQDTITGELTNDGPEAATDAVLSIESPDEDVVPLRDEYVLGDLDDGDDEEFSFPVRVAETAEPGARQFEFVVTYLDENGDPRGSETLLAAVDVEDERAQFELDDVDEDLQVGADGTIDLTLNNELDEDLTEARVSIASPNADLEIAGDENASRFVGEWDEDEEETVSVSARLDADSDAESYPLVATVAYTDEDGETNRSDPIRFGVTPADEQEFRIGSVQSTLSVGDEGVVRGRLTNAGPRNVSNVVLRLVNTSQNVDPREEEFAVDRLAAGSSTRFSFPIDIRENAEPGPRQVTFRVEYRDAEDDRQESDTIPVRVRVRPETDEFDIRPVGTDVQVGETGTITLVVSNNRNYTLRDINAKVFVNDPLSSGDDEAFVSKLGPNETVRLEFDVSASGDASTKTFPLKIDFQYEEPDGETTLSDTYQIGVNVTESEGGLLGDLLSVSAAIVSVLLPVAGVYFWRRQRE